MLPPPPGCSSPHPAHASGLESFIRVEMIPSPCGCVEGVLEGRRRGPWAPDILRASLSSPSSRQGPARLSRAAQSADLAGLLPLTGHQAPLQGGGGGSRGPGCGGGSGDERPITPVGIRVTTLRLGFSADGKDGS